PQRVAWEGILRLLEEHARGRHGRAFTALDGPVQDDLIRQLQAGALGSAELPAPTAALVFRLRVLRDAVHAYYSHPVAWDEIGFGGPASPRGYVRMGFNRRDPWEAAEVRDGDANAARRANARVR